MRDSSGTTRGPAIWATTLALALLNVGLALLVVEAIGVHAFAPWWVGGLVLVLGIVAATAAVMLWRAYLANARSR